jgi:hypothetical protein
MLISHFKAPEEVLRLLPTPDHSDWVTPAHPGVAEAHS